MTGTDGGRRRFHNRIGRRGAALLFFALLDYVYAYALLNPPTPLTSTYLWPQTLMPLWAWAACWAGVGVLCLVYAVLDHDAVAYAAAIAIKVLWGTVLGLGWLAGVIDRGYVSAVIWMAFAAFVYLIAGGIPAAPPGRKRRMWTRS